MFGVGIESGWAYETSDSDVISVQVVETFAFNPTEKYVRDTMAAGPSRRL